MEKIKFNLIGETAISCSQESTNCPHRKVDPANYDLITVFDPSTPVCFHPEAPHIGHEKPGEGKRYRYCRS